MSSTDDQTSKMESLKINIIWRLHRNGTVHEQAIPSSCPSSVLRVFSPFCTRQLDATPSPVLTLQHNSLSNPRRFTIVIDARNCEYESACTIFEWMLDYSDGNTDLPCLKPHPFLQAFKFLDVAKALEIDILIQDLEAEITKLSQSMPDPEDIVAVMKHYSSTDYADHPARITIIEAMANAIFTEPLVRYDPSHVSIFEGEQALAAAVDSLVTEKTKKWTANAIATMDQRAGLLVELRAKDRVRKYIEQTEQAAEEAMVPIWEKAE